MTQRPIGIIEPVGGHGGMDYYDYGLASGLGSTGQHVRLYTCDVTTVRIYDNVKTILAFKRLWHGGNFFKAIRYICGHLRAFQDLKRHGGTIVHVHFFTFRIVDLLVLWLAKFWHFKVVATIHDVNAFDKVAKPKIEKWCYKLIDSIIVHNKVSFNLLHEKNNVRCPVTIIAHGNYLPFIKQVPSSKIEKGEPFTLLFFGQIKEVKGLDLLLAAVGSLVRKQVNIRLIIAGKPWKSDKSQYISLIEELGISHVVNANFTFIPDNQISRYYEMADLVVLPYREIYQSGVLLLSMSYGKSVLCSDLDAFSEVIQDNVNGFLFKRESIESLESKLKEIVYAGGASLENISIAAQKFVKENHDWRNIGILTKALYKTIDND
jgi:D-inositol-3-phosphate glycosyltransferase